MATGRVSFSHLSYESDDEWGSVIALTRRGQSIIFEINHICAHNTVTKLTSITLVFMVSHVCSPYPKKLSIDCLYTSDFILHSSCPPKTKQTK